MRGGKQLAFFLLLLLLLKLMTTDPGDFYNMDGDPYYSKDLPFGLLFFHLLKDPLAQTKISQPPEG